MPYLVSTLKQKWRLARARKPDPRGYRALRDRDTCAWKTRPVYLGAGVAGAKKDKDYKVKKLPDGEKGHSVDKVQKREGYRTPPEEDDASTSKWKVSKCNGVQGARWQCLSRCTAKVQRALRK